MAHSSSPGPGSAGVLPSPADGVAGTRRTGTARPTVSLFVEARFGLDSRGDWAAVERVHGGSGWSRYAHAGRDLRLVARARRRIDTGAVALGGAAEVHPLPYYVGVRGLVRALPGLAVAVAREVARADTVVLRIPGAIGALAACSCRVLRRRYAVEVAGDPLGVLSSGALGRTGRLLAPWVAAQMRWVVRGASAALYVTDFTLQRRYPPRPGVPVTSVSTVRLEDSAFATRSRPWRPGPARLVTVGSQEVPYKGHDVLLRAARLLRSRGVPVTAVIVGDGRLHRDLIDLAAQLGVSDCVTFTGAIHDRALLQAQLDEASLFVLPSRTEGLPRALLEAMARALPAVASDVGGIPELLEPDCLVPVEDAAALADAVAALTGDPVRWQRQSQRNLDVARGYHVTRLEARFAQWLGTVPCARPQGHR